jgi:hypothetical protein
MILFGWTMDQWAIVFAAFPPKGLDAKGILESKKRWDLARRYAPGSERLLIADRGGNVEHKPDMDWDSAVAMFSNGAWFEMPDFPKERIKDPPKSIVSRLFGLH